MDKQLFNLRFAAKSLQRAAKKAAKEESQERQKMERALLAQNPDAARIHAECAVRKHADSLNYLRLSARIEAVAARLKAAMGTRAVTTAMAQAATGLERALQANRLDEAASVLGRFEQCSDSLAVQADCMETLVQGDGTILIGEEAALLLQQAADKHGLAVQTALLGAVPSKDNGTAAESGELLEERLAKLREL